MTSGFTIPDRPSPVLPIGTWSDTTATAHPSGRARASFGQITNGRPRRTASANVSRVRAAYQNGSTRFPSPWFNAPGSSPSPPKFTTSTVAQPSGPTAIGVKSNAFPTHPRSAPATVAANSAR